MEVALAKEKELSTKLREQQHKYSDLESKMKDEAMMARIRDAEHAQQVAELVQRISRLELKVVDIFQNVLNMNLHRFNCRTRKCTRRAS